MDLRATRIRQLAIASAREIFDSPHSCFHTPEQTDVGTNLLLVAFFFLERKKKSGYLLSSSHAYATPLSCWNAARVWVRDRMHPGLPVSAACWTAALGRARHASLMNEQGLDFRRPCCTRRGAACSKWFDVILAVVRRARGELAWHTYGAGR